MHPVANINGRAIFTQSAPSAQIRAISNADTILPEAAIFIELLKLAARSALSTYTIASRRGLPT